MANNKVWRLRGKEETYTDEKLVELISSGVIKPDDYIASREMRVWIKVKNSIYQYYIKEEMNETI